MTTTREMRGVANLTGQRVNTLIVGEMIARNPRPKYNVTCGRCGTKTTAGQQQISSGVARCQFTGCGRERLREIANDTPSRARKREEIADAARRREREEQQAAELAEAEAEFKELNRKVNATIRENILKLRDDEFQIDPATFTPLPKGVSAVDWNSDQVQLFLKSNPAYYPCKENLEAMTAYIDRNAPGIKLMSALQWEQAYRRLNEYGLLKQRPAPELAPRQQPVRVNLDFSGSEPEPVKPSGPKTYGGRDWETGREREFTQREVDRMSSKEYARAFPVAPTMAELLSAMKTERT